jgi:hypothetical protein
MGKYKKVWLTEKGQTKTGASHLRTTDEKIEHKGGQTIVTGRDTGRQWVLDSDDIEVIQDG